MSGLSVLSICLPVLSVSPKRVTFPKHYPTANLARNENYFVLSKLIKKQQKNCPSFFFFGGGGGLFCFFSVSPPPPPPFFGGGVGGCVCGWVGWGLVRVCVCMCVCVCVCVCVCGVCVCFACVLICVLFVFLFSILCLSERGHNSYTLPDERYWIKNT